MNNQPIYERTAFAHGFAPLPWPEDHRPVDYKGRTVCSCGDFNCASLDANKETR